MDVSMISTLIKESVMDYFTRVCKYISENPNNYKENFMFAACENWLRNEICKIINFKLEPNFKETESSYAFDEKKKIDLQIIDADGVHNIELKTIYLTTHGKSKSIADTLSRQMKDNIENTKTSEGWVFFICNSNHKKSINLDSSTQWVINQAHKSICSHLTLLKEKTNPILLLSEHIRWKCIDQYVAVSAIRFRVNDTNI